MVSVRVFSWNILSQGYCNSENYPNCNPNYITPSYRQNIIMEKLALEMSKKSIICLQELDIVFYNRLCVFFTSNNYSHLFNSYDRKSSLYMGVLTAWPLDYKVANVNQVRVGDSVMVTRERATYSHVDDEKDPWNVAAWRRNWMIMVNFEIGGKQFIVANYHMPCTYWCESATLLHAGSVIEILKSYWNDIPVILASDCNFKPGTEAYDLFKTMEYKTPKNLNCKDDEKLFKSIDSGLCNNYFSVYHKHNGKEPEYTLWTTTFNEGTIFKDTLDYIWINSENIKIQSVDELPYDYVKQDSEGLMPNKFWASDHFSLAANLIII